MIPRRFSSQAIILSRKNYSEADRILVIFTKDYGKVTLLAKGVRKPKSRKRGALEVFSHLKFIASRAKGFDLITEAEIVNSYNRIRDDLKKVSVAYFFLETVNRLTREEEKNRELFVFLIDYLSKLEDSNRLRLLRKEFIYNILVLVGFWPEGKEMKDPDSVLESVVEREMTSARVGKKVLS